MSRQRNGNFGNQINQGSQDAYLTKYDSAGNVLWTKLLGSTGSASTATRWRSIRQEASSIAGARRPAIWSTGRSRRRQQ